MPAPTAAPSKKISASYRCFSYNVSGGGGGDCRLFAPLILKADGTYAISSEQGTYAITGDRIVLSQSKLRGPGMLLEGDRQIRFSYDYNGWHHVLTYLREENVAVPATSAAKQASSVEATIRVMFAEGDYSADSVNAMTLFVRGTNEQVAESLAYPIDKQTIEAWFSKKGAKEGIPTGKAYDVFVSTGFGQWKVGELDATDATADIAVTIAAPAQ